jgi:hypothetical protein
MTAERWVPIPGENYYSVSDRGRVRSEHRHIWRAGNPRGLLLHCAGDLADQRRAPRALYAKHAVRQAKS